MPSTSLPQRARGGYNGPRPPARVARPALSAAFLERVRAAIQADADAEAEDHIPEAGPVPLPRRDLGGTGARQSPAEPAPPAASPGTSTPGDDNTDPIPVIKAQVSTSAGAPAPAAGDAGAPPENAAPAKPGTAGAPAKSQAGTAPPKPKAVKAPPKPKAVPAPPKPKAVKAPPKPAPTHRGPRTGPGAGKLAKREDRASRSYRMAGVLVTTVTVGLLAAGFAVFHHAGGNPAGGSSGAGRSGPRTVVPADPATLTASAAAWVAAQVAPDTVISCDPAMCQALKARRIPASRLYVLKPGKTNPLDSAVIVATPILRSQIGSRLTSVYAPGLLARFGSGNRQIQVRAIAQHGPAAYMSQVKADLALRKLSGTQLAQSSGIMVSTAAKKQLASGAVDARLMTVITGLASHYPVHVVAFGDSGPSAAVAPLRSAELAGSNVNKMLATLRRQQSRQSPFRVTNVGLLRLRTGQTVLRIAFDAPSPFGLLG